MFGARYSTCSIQSHVHVYAYTCTSCTVHVLPIYMYVSYVYMYYLYRFQYHLVDVTLLETINAKLAHCQVLIKTEVSINIHATYTGQAHVYVLVILFIN